MIAEQIIHSRVAAIAREMAETVGRTARSGGIAEGRRFAAAMLTGTGKVAAQWQHDAEHVYLVRDSVVALLDYFAFDLGSGDVVMVGDPYSGGSTPQCLTIALPVFHEGALEFFLAVRAEFADLAGEFPGVLHPFATETWQEGIRITPVKLYRHGVLQRDVLRLILRNSRAESLVRSDLQAIVTALNAAAADATALVDEHGCPSVQAAITAGIGHGSQLGRAHLAQFADIDRMTKRIVSPTDGATIQIRVRVHHGDNRGIVVEADGTSAPTALPFNMTTGHARGYAFVAAFAELLDTVIVTDGLMELLQLHGTAGTLLAAARPAATGLSSFVTGHLVAGAVREALYGSRNSLRIDGPTPSMVLFDPIGGNPDNPPRVLSPGFAVSAQGFGAPVLSGGGLLPSAEVSEARDGLGLLRREYDEAGHVQVVVRNLRGLLEANVFVPVNDDGSGGTVRLVAKGVDRLLSNAVSVPIPSDSTLSFVYPSYVETPQ